MGKAWCVPGRRRAACRFAAAGGRAWARSVKRSEALAFGSPPSTGVCGRQPEAAPCARSEAGAGERGTPRSRASSRPASRPLDRARAVVPARAGISSPRPCPGRPPRPIGHLARPGRMRRCFRPWRRGLRHRGLAAVVGEVGRLPLIASRRLQLAAESTGAIAFVIRRWRSRAEDRVGEPRPRSRAGASRRSRRRAPGPGLGRARWRSNFPRQGRRTPFLDPRGLDAKGRLRLPPDLADGQVAPDRARDALPWDRPVVTQSRTALGGCVARSIAAARRLGLRPGMPVAHAQACVADLAVFEASPEEDRAGLERWRPGA